MKTNQLTVAALLFLIAIPFMGNAKVWRVNNNPGITADFKTAQEAHNAAAAGDTLHIEPSPANYGNLVLSKPLTIISIGNFLGVDTGLQASPVKTATMQNLTVNAGAGGSVLSCNFSGTTNITGCNNIRFERSYLLGVITLNNSDSIVIISTYCGNATSFSNNSNTILITNSLLAYIINMDATCDAKITNNVIGIGGQTQFNGAQNIYNSTFQNNIIKNGQNYNYTNCTVTNNITAGNANSLPNSNANQLEINMSDVFVNPTTFNDLDYQLKDGSLALKAGVNGEDDGAFGGATPFKLGLQPAIPAIYKLTAPSATVGNTLNIVFSTKSNN